MSLENLQYQTSNGRNPFLLDDFLPIQNKNKASQLLTRSLERLLGLDYLAREYEKLPDSKNPAEFVQQSFSVLDVNFDVIDGCLKNIPTDGPVMVVANHPFGAIEGMYLLELLQRQRSDVRIMANGILKRVPELADAFIGVNPYGGAQAKKANFAAMREGMNWLKNGGLLVMFPAGDVASFKVRKMGIHEGVWDRTVARLAMRCEADVVPIHFSGYNSRLFYLISALNPLLKTLMLPRQMSNKQGQSIEVRIGKTISNKRLSRLSNDEERSSYMRLRTLLLGSNKTGKTGRLEYPVDDDYEPIIDALEAECLEGELQNLPAHQKLLSSGKFEVYYAAADQIPHILTEIGRLRELSFRRVGEGSGKSLDIDLYDEYYLQLFIWNREEREIVGGYRLGLADEIIRRFGRKGLYSYSLFKFKRSFIYKVNPALELGRSFVAPAYQRSFSPLMLLWKGISHFVMANPRYSTLFGPVSISDEYSNTSKQLLIDFLRMNEFDKQLSKTLRPRNPYAWCRDIKQHTSSEVQRLKGLDELSELMADIEIDNKGVPVLIRQYLKMGGRMLGFNVDSDFSNVVDGLIYVDLLQTDGKTLAKYMGHEGIKKFKEWHKHTVLRQA